MSLLRLLPLLLLTQTACAALPTDRQAGPRDRFERYNRSMYRFNTAADRAVLRPLARGYVRVLPQPVRRGIGHFLTNVAYPRTIVNDLLQGKLADGARDTARLAVNTVVGLGFFDPATRLGLEQHDEDFGQTLGKWGVPAGPYLMLPLLGPSTIRDTVSRVPDDYATPRHYLQDPYARWGLITLDVVDTRAGLLATDAVLRDSFDPYALVRNAWLQRREYAVRDGNVPAEDLAPDTEPSDDATDPPPATP
jgi:phospholipid-binding lipoprotein MlaA